ncbi:hypothetical protein jhhlp_000842 [Lomentospora prolificans]|uniref:Xylanolytic transcriptional activator regulatory domain-containing protein n=1 Tax=Lomentospora prolificans TaxID=41688 RepID=A0A2N3NJN0_9PEZI|nr:hypothetical protein jhhlp_000842 [Lomentospora prolificans]
MGRAINTLIANDTLHQGPNDFASPTPSLSTHSIHSSCSLDGSSKAGPCPTLPVRSESQRECRPSDNQTDANSEPKNESEPVVEGSSSLSAHSSLAIDFLHKVAGADRQRGYTFETRELLDSLHNIVDAMKTLRQSPESLFTLALPSAPVGHEDCTMPPIQAAVAVIRKAQEQHHITLVFLGELLRFRSLSDLCLKVYFSQDYSIAEFIIVNIALYNLFHDIDIRSADQQQSGSSDEGRLMCQRNLETALSGLPLQLRPTYDMTLALALGAIYAVDVSKPSLAWVFVSAAYQASYTLGCHTRAQGADERGDAPNPHGLLFWIIYFLEKTLCLRLGRCSAIPDYEITVPLPGTTPAMNYCRNAVRLASLAGKIYEKLYSAHSLALSDELRRQRTVELSGELHSIQEQSRSTLRTWLKSGVDEYQHELIGFMSTSDEVLWLSILTLIHRAVPALPGSRTSLTDECIASARAALASHQSSIPTIGTGGPALLSSYINWTILFSPFIPFIVLFCYVLETGDLEDLDRMQTFVDSIESACHHSNAISKHHRLFQVFHNVALRYTELKTASTPSQDGQTEVRTEMDAYLHALGFYPHAGSNVTADNQNLTESSSMMSPTMLHLSMPTDALDVTKGAELPSHLANWYSVSQQMIELLDSDQLPPL